MSNIVGSGAMTYRIVEGWGRLPDGWELYDVAAVGVDSNDHLYVFHRGRHPVIVFDRDGNFLRSWGDDLFRHAHGIHIAHDGALHLTDDFDHTVRKCTPEGKLLMTIGEPGQPSMFM